MLSLSDYVFNTQLQNLKKSGGQEFVNIKFFTYAKLMLMSKQEMLEIKPDYIVLDEIHRAGAEMWGKGVSDFVSLYKDIPMLGMSATPIRYLDNQRNMADELLVGNIASEISLGEAIAIGILPTPKYVLSVYLYEK